MPHHNIYNHVYGPIICPYYLLSISPTMLSFLRKTCVPIYKNLEVPSTYVNRSYVWKVKAVLYSRLVYFTSAMPYTLDHSQGHSAHLYLTMSLWLIGQYNNFFPSGLYEMKVTLLIKMTYLITYNNKMVVGMGDFLSIASHIYSIDTNYEILVIPGQYL